MTSDPALLGVDAESARDSLNRVRAEVAKVVVGQDAAVSGLLVALADDLDSLERKVRHP